MSSLTRKRRYSSVVNDRSTPKGTSALEKNAYPKRLRQDDIPLASQNNGRSRSSFLYRPLDEAKQEIRVMTLLAGPDDTEISATLEYEYLPEAKPFAALSYCWGPAHDEAAMTLDDQVKSIRKNLWQALWRLRQGKGTLRIWVDFICINQNDPQERGHQVRMMKDIFSTASLVYVWLGEASPRTHKAVEYLSQVAQSGYIRPNDAEERRRRAAGLRLLRDVWGREYWTRLWIIQEIVLARDVQIMIGVHEIPWHSLKSVYKAKRSSNGGPFPKSSIIPAIWKLQRNISSDLERIELQGLMCDFCPARCHDARDRIYGMLGMVSSTVRQQVIIDYKAPLLIVYLDNLENIFGPNVDLLLAIIRTWQIFGIESLSREEMQRLSAFERLQSDFREKYSIDAHFTMIVGECQILAAKQASDPQFAPYVGAQAGLDYDIYVTRIKVVDGSQIRNHILYSCTCLQEGDFVLSMLTNFALIARKRGASLGIVDIGLMLFDYASTLRWADPDQWFRERIQLAQIQLSTPLKASVTISTPESRRCEVMLNILLNGSSFAELVRDERLETLPLESMQALKIGWDPVCLVKVDEVVRPMVSEACREAPSCEGGAHLEPGSYNLGKFVIFLRNKPDLGLGVDGARFRTGSVIELVSAFEVLSPISRTSAHSHCSEDEDTLTTSPRKRRRHRYRGSAQSWRIFDATSTASRM